MSDDKQTSPGGGLNAYLILLIVGVLAYLATWLVPSGAFETIVGESGRTQIVPGSFALANNGTPMGAPLFGDAERAGFLSFMFEGLISGDRHSATIGLMAFILIIGGTFGVILDTGALDRVLTGTLKRAENSNGLLIPGLFIAFSLAGAVFGMSEEAIVFTLLVAPPLVRSGYDSITAILVTYAATQIGFATSWMNPFSVLVAQGIAEVPVMSGLLLRVAMWSAFTSIGAFWVYRYAVRIRRSPETSLAFANDARLREEGAKGQTLETAGVGDLVVLALTALGVIWVAWGVSTQGYYLAEISAQFFALALVAGTAGVLFKLNGKSAGDLASAFADGAARLAPAALIIGFAKGVILLLGGDDPSGASVFNTILFQLSGFAEALPDWGSALGMLGVQSVINIFVVSGSGQAALTMPLMAPLADLSGVSRQTAVLAFQLGDGLMNLVVPASAALMGSLAAARLDWAIWVRFAWKPLLGLFALAAAFVTLAQLIGYS